MLRVLFVFQTFSIIIMLVVFTISSSEIYISIQVKITELRVFANLDVN